MRQIHVSIAVMLVVLQIGALVLLPEEASGAPAVNMKVVVIDELLEIIDHAEVHCVNVHTSARYDLSWNESSGQYRADVPPGSYCVFASAEGFMKQGAPLVVEMLTSASEDEVNAISLDKVPAEISLDIEVRDGYGEVAEGARVHILSGRHIHLTEETNTSGGARFRMPRDLEMHILVFHSGSVTYSMTGKWNESGSLEVNLSNEPASLEGSYRVMGFLKNGSLFISGGTVHVWDVDHDHEVPIQGQQDGAISLPLYEGHFHLLVEAEGYEPEWIPDIDLENHTYHTLSNDTLEMTRIDVPSSIITTIDLSANIVSPVVRSVRTMDANSVIWGAGNTFGNPRMQVSGPFHSADWYEVDHSEEDGVEYLLRSYGPPRITTEEFLKVNNMSYRADTERYALNLEGLAGNVLEKGTNPKALMFIKYSSDLNINLLKDDIRVEIMSIADGEIIEIRVPSHYEILGDFGDRADIIDGNTSALRVFEPIVFNSKIKEPPVADLHFVNSYDHHGET
ncbi:MAG: hypothetical protein ACMUHY_06010, partial [Thermoplasmatota archaeon]